MPDDNWNTSENYKLTDKDHFKFVVGYINNSKQLYVVRIWQKDINENRIYYSDGHYLTKWKFTNENNA